MSPVVRAFRAAPVTSVVFASACILFAGAWIFGSEPMGAMRWIQQLVWAPLVLPAYVLMLARAVMIAGVGVSPGLATLVVLATPVLLDAFIRGVPKAASRWYDRTFPRPTGGQGAGKK